MENYFFETEGNESSAFEAMIFHKLYDKLIKKIQPFASENDRNIVMCFERTEKRKGTLNA